MSPRLFLLVAAALLAGVRAGPALHAQETDLDRVEALLSEGRFSSARAVLQGWLEDEASASREQRQRGTWLRAVLTVDPEMAAIDLRRLVVRYPGGSYSDRALLRLAQGAWVLSEEVRALEYLEDLLRDYPETRLRERAQALSGEIQAALAPTDPRPQNP